MSSTSLSRTALSSAAGRAILAGTGVEAGASGPLGVLLRAFASAALPIASKLYDQVSHVPRSAGAAGNSVKHFFPGSHALRVPEAAGNCWEAARTQGGSCPANATPRTPCWGAAVRGFHWARGRVRGGAGDAAPGGYGTNGSALQDHVALGGRRTFAAGCGSGGAGSSASPKAPPKKRLPNGLRGVKKIVAVASGKGGVGKSTLSANLAAALAQHHGLKVGLCDADIYGPSVPTMMKLSGRPLITDGDDPLMVPLRNHRVDCNSMGFLMDADEAAVWRGPMVMGAFQKLMFGTAWGELDVLVVDMPPGTGDIQLSLGQLVPLDGAVIVSTPQDIALIDARRGVSMFRKIMVPVLGVVENMSAFVCGNCGHESHVFGQGGVARAAEDMDMEVLGEIPLHIDIRQQADAGAPIVVSSPESEAARPYKQLAARVWEKLCEGRFGARK